MNDSLCRGCISLQTRVFGIGVFSMMLALLLYIRVQLDPSGVWYMHLTPTVYLVSGILLVQGVKNRLLELVLPSVCIYFTSIVLLIPMQFFQQFSSAIHTAELIPIFMTMATGILFAFSIYFFLVINSFYQELLREKYVCQKTDNDDNPIAWNVPYSQYV